MLTLGELKKLVEIPEVQDRMPTVHSLRRLHIPIVVKEVLGKGNEITVYANGMVAYQSNGHGAVFYLHTCGEYRYCSNTLDTYRINEKLFENERWYIRLMLEGEDQILENIKKRERVNTVSYHAISEDWEALKTEDVLMRELLSHETIEELFLPLTERQKSIVAKMYLEQMNQFQISNLYGISQQSVSDTIRKAIRRLRKIYRLEDFF